MNDEKKLTRRKVIEKAAYVAPVILSFKAAPAFAKTGSQKPGRRKHGLRPEPRSRSRRDQGGEK